MNIFQLKFNVQKFCGKFLKNSGFKRLFKQSQRYEAFLMHRYISFTLIFLFRDQFSTKVSKLNYIQSRVSLDNFTEFL